MGLKQHMIDIDLSHVRKKNGEASIGRKSLFQMDVWFISLKETDPER